MSEYYAVVRSGDTLSHYGPKGTKWGARRAISSGNNGTFASRNIKTPKKFAKPQAKVANIANINHPNITPTNKAGISHHVPKIGPSKIK